MSDKVIRATLRLPKGDVEHWERLMLKESVDYDEEGISKYSCVYLKTAKFEDGRQVDLKVCTSGDSSDLWSEAVMFNEFGNELCCSEVCDSLRGEWRFFIGDTDYVLDVEVEDDENGTREPKGDKEMDDEAVKLTMRIPEEQVERWNGLLEKKSIDYEKEDLPRNSVVFIKTARFPDRTLVDLKVCTSNTNDPLVCSVVVYDEFCNELWASESSAGICGICGEWEFSLKKVHGGFKKYVLNVVSEDGAYRSLCCTPEDFCEVVQKELEGGITSEYSQIIAEAIADKVAEDVADTADDEEWNTSDVRLGIGRVLASALGFEV